jgi:hypothetical protein
MVHFLGVPLGGRIALHALKWRNLHKNNMSAPPSGWLISIRWNGAKKYKGRLGYRAHSPVNAKETIGCAYQNMCFSPF